MEGYSVKQLAKLAGVSVRTLHLYDQKGLLKPQTRTTAGYRLYGEKELLRLQQILFYKELDFPLKEIKTILSDPFFDLLNALEGHRAALHAREKRIAVLLATIDKTISNLKEGFMLTHEELYEGLSKGQAEKYREEAIHKYGQREVETSENGLRRLGKDGLAGLKKKTEQIRQNLFALIDNDPESALVQEQVALHYQNIRKFWGTQFSEDKQADAYKGLGELYLEDERFTMIEGMPQPNFALFLSTAMSYFSKQLR
jgi:DNA-binding transcriptional MerR regulator